MGDLNGKNINAEDLEFSLYDGEEVEVSPLLREQLLLALPTRPLCQDECRGLCSQCGVNLNLKSCSCSAPTLGPTGSKLCARSSFRVTDRRDRTDNTDNKGRFISMPVPKRRTSKSKRNKRRAHDALTPVNPIACPQCGEPALPHRVCAPLRHLPRTPVGGGRGIIRRGAR